MNTKKNLGASWYVIVVASYIHYTSLDLFGVRKNRTSDHVEGISEKVGKAACLFSSREVKVTLGKSSCY